MIYTNMSISGLSAATPARRRRHTQRPRMGSNFRHMYLSTLLLITCCFSVCISVITDLTIEIKPGVNECLYQFVRANTAFEVEYQVVNLFYYRPRPVSLGCDQFYV